MAKTQKFFGKNFFICKKVRNFVSEINKAMEENSMITELRMFADMTGGNQKEFFEFQLASAKVVKCVPLKELFSNEEIKLIKILVKPQKRECYKNAHLMTNYFSGVEYVEGKVKLDCGISIEHAFNRKGDKYFDITWELALNDKTDGVEYLSIGEYDQETINRIAFENEVYGGIVRSIFFKQKFNKLSL